MSNRFKTALQIQEGASNRRLVSRKLHEMIVEVSDAGGDPDSDPAVFLVLHQLVWILAGRDIGEHRWQQATKACVDKVAEVAERGANEVKAKPDQHVFSKQEDALHEAHLQARQHGYCIVLPWDGEFRLFPASDRASAHAIVGAGRIVAEFDASGAQS